MSSCVTGQCGLGDWDGPVPGDPSNNITLTATPAYGGIDITWTYPATNPHAIAYFKLFRGFTDQYQLATELPPVGGGYYFDKIRTVQTCYYWIQGISKNGTIAAAIGPAVATSKLTISETIEELTGKIDAGMLATTLRADISQISLTKADLFKEIKDREDGQTSLAQSISDAQNGVAQAHTFILQEANSRISQNAVLAERIEGVAASIGSGTGSVIAAMQVTIDQHTTDLGTLTTTVNSLYTVKLTANGLIGGFGLSNNGSSVEAGFDVDKFWIGRTGADKRKPFIIDGGVVYIDDAAIRKLTFEKLRAADGSVIVENGKLKADYISGKGLQIYNPAGDKLIVDPSAAKPIDNSVINPAAGWLNSNVALTRGQTVTLNPECTNTTEWTGPGIDFVKSVTGIPNGTAIGNLSGIGGQTLISKTPAPFDSARRYRVSALCFSSSGTGACYLGVVWVDRNGADIIGTSPTGWGGGNYSYFGLVNQTPPTAAGYYSQEFGFGVTACEVPANAVAMRLCFLPNYSNTGGARHYVTDFKIEDITDVTQAAKTSEWAGVTSRPKHFVVRSVGNGGPQPPASWNTGTGVYDAETLAVVQSTRRSWGYAQLNRAGVRVGGGNFDLYGNGEIGGTGADFLWAMNNHLTKGNILVVFSYDEPLSNFWGTAGLADALCRHGASKSVLKQLTSGCTYIMVGIVGCGEGRGSEIITGGGSPDSWAELSFSIFNGSLNVSGVTGGPKSVKDLDYSGDLNATYGAPSGTFVGGTLAEVVRDGAANGSSAYNAIVDSATGLNRRLLNGANNVLQYGSRIIAGNLSLSGSGAYQGGYGVAMTQGGIVGVRNGGFLTFSLDAGTGNAVFGGELSAAYGTLGSLTIANGGFVRAGKPSFGAGVGYYFGWDSSGPVLDVGTSDEYLRWSVAGGLDFKQLSFSVSSMGTFNLDVPRGDQSYGTYSCPTPVNGKAPFTYVWGISHWTEIIGGGGDKAYITGGINGASVTVRGSSGTTTVPNIIHAELSCQIIDSRGRVATTFLNIDANHGGYSG